jgi:hypothetical protein
MANLFGIDLQALFATAMGGQLLPMTLKKRVPGTTYDPLDPSAGPRYAETSYSVKGVVEMQEAFEGDLVRIKKGRATVLLGTITPKGIRPEPGDVLTVTVPGTTTTQDVNVVDPCDYDPAGVQATVSVRG